MIGDASVHASIRASVHPSIHAWILHMLGA